MKSRLSFLIVALLVFIVAGAWGQSLATTEDGRQVRLFENGTWEYVDDTLNDYSAAIGETGGIIRVVGFRQFVEPNQFIGPDEGMKFVAVEIVVDNSDGTVPIDFNFVWGAGIELKDSELYSYDVTFESLSNSISPEFPDDPVEVGDSTRGWITLAVREEVEQSGLRLRYVSSLNRDRRSDWIPLGGL